MQEATELLAMVDQHNGRSGTFTPPTPSKAYSVSSSLDKIDNLESFKLQDLDNQSRMMDQNPNMESENIPTNS